MALTIRSITVAPLDNLADQIHDDLRRREGARTEWINATIDLCLHLVEARDKFTADQEFSKWLIEHKLDTDVLSKNDRAAAIAMGRHMEETRKVLEQTERRSLRLIHEQEFQPRFPTTGKPAPDTATASPIPTPVSRRKPVEAPKAAAVKQRPSVSEPVVERTDLSMSAQQKLDVAIRKHQRELDAAFEEAVRAESNKRLDEFVLPHYHEKAKQAERVVKARKGIMPRATFRKLLACLHPDQITDEDKKPRYNDAFNTFKELELVLVAEPENPTSTASSKMPQTVEELMKMRKTKRR